MFLYATLDLFSKTKHSNRIKKPEIISISSVLLCGMFCMSMRYVCVCLWNILFNVRRYVSLITAIHNDYDYVCYRHKVEYTATCTAPTIRASSTTATAFCVRKCVRKTMTTRHQHESSIIVRIMHIQFTSNLLTLSADNVRTRNMYYGGGISLWSCGLHPKMLLAGVCVLQVRRKLMFSVWLKYNM